MHHPSMPRPSSVANGPLDSELFGVDLDLLATLRTENESDIDERTLVVVDQCRVECLSCESAISPADDPQIEQTEIYCESVMCHLRNEIPGPLPKIVCRKYRSASLLWSFSFMGLSSAPLLRFRVQTYAPIPPRWCGVQQRRTKYRPWCSMLLWVRIPSMTELSAFRDVLQTRPGGELDLEGEAEGSTMIARGDDAVEEPGRGPASTPRRSSAAGLARVVVVLPAPSR